MIYFNNGITVDTAVFGSNPLIDDSLVGIANDYDISIAYDEYQSIASAMRVKTTSTVSAHQKFGYRIAGRELSLLADGQNKTKRTAAYGNKKGYLTKDYGDEFHTTYKAYQYLKNQNTLQGASSDVQEEYMTLINDSKDLNLWRMESYIIEHAALFTQGWDDDNTYGPGSPTPNLKSLFNAAHPILATGGTFSNVLSTADQELTKETLQEALNILKRGVKLQNGKFVKQGRGVAYKLYVGTTQEVVARQILNTYGKQAMTFAGGYGAATGNSNANMINQFYFEGNLVEIEALPNLGDVVNSEYGYGTSLGGQTNWFVMNPFVIEKQESLKKFEDYPPRMKNYELISSDTYVVDIRANCGVDHYYAETGIVGSRGTVSA